MDSVLLTNNLLLKLCRLIIQSLHDFHRQLLNQIEISILPRPPQHINEPVFVHEVKGILTHRECQALFDLYLENGIVVLEEGIARIAFHNQELFVLLDNIKQIVVVIFNHRYSLIEDLIVT